MRVRLGVAAIALAAAGASANPLLLLLGGTVDAALNSGTYYADLFNGAANCATGTSTVLLGARAEGAPDGVFTTDTGGTTWEGQWTMEYPASAVACTGTQTIQLRVRKSASGGSNSAVIQVYTDATDNGDCSANLVTSYCTGATISSAVGQDVTCALPCTVMPDTWPQIQIEIVGQFGGSGAQRRDAQIDAITWSANWTE